MRAVKLVSTLFISLLFSSLVHAGEPRLVEVIYVYKFALAGIGERNRDSNGKSANDYAEYAEALEAPIGALEGELAEIRAKYEDEKSKVLKASFRPGYLKNYENLVLDEWTAKISGQRYEGQDPKTFLELGFGNSLPPSRAMADYLKVARPYLKTLAKKNRLIEYQSVAKRKYTTLVRKIIQSANTLDVFPREAFYRSDLPSIFKPRQSGSFEVVAVVIRTDQSEVLGQKRPLIVFQPGEKDPVGIVDDTIERIHSKSKKSPFDIRDPKPRESVFDIVLGRSNRIQRFKIYDPKPEYKRENRRL